MFSVNANIATVSDIREGGDDDDDNGDLIPCFIAAESTNARVKWWSLGQLALLAAVCFLQVVYLKRFFEVKRVV